MKTLLLSAFTSAFLFGQHSHPQMDSGEKPVVLYKGLGTWHHAIATSNPDAQKFFDQGLALMYGFNRYEAMRSFRKATELDPKAAMGYWGIAMSYGPYLNMDMDPSYDMKQSCEAVNKGRAVQGISAGDRAWLDAAAARCPDFADPGAYINAMKQLAASLPDDPDAQTLYAEALLVRPRWRWYDGKGQSAEGVSEAEHVLEAVLRRFPDHPGANHLYIHAVESSPNPERAIPSAQRLMGIVPSAGHLVHMPGHIWLVLGDFENTVAVNERAAQVDREYFQKTGVMGSYYPYYLHNLSFVVYARGMQGRNADAEHAEQEMMDAIKPIEPVMPEMVGAFSSFVTLAKVRLCRWKEVLGAPAPKTQDPTTLAIWRYSRTIALAAQGDAAGAARERAEFEEVRKKIDRKGQWSVNSVGEVMDLASAILEARTEASPAKAVEKWKHAVEIQDALVYDEPPAWYYPVRESLGAALLRAGDASDAEAVFREGLRRSPNNGRMLFGLLQILKAQHKDEAAGWVERELKAAWKGADLELRLADL